MNLYSHWRRSLALIGTAAAVAPLAIAAGSPAAAGADTTITNPAQHPYPITVTIEGQTYHDGEDTLPGYDDYLCTPIPDVQYDFADNEILYYDDQGNLLDTAPWTEWSRISSYQTWQQQQQQQQSGSGSGNSTSSSSSSSNSGNSNSSSSSSSSNSNSGSNNSSNSGSSSSNPSSSNSSSSNGSSNSSNSASPNSGSSSAPVATVKSSLSARIAVSTVAGSITKTPTTKAGGKYKVKIETPRGKAAAAGTVTITLHKGSKKKTIKSAVAHGAAVVKLPKLAKGSWNVAIAWTGDTHYLGHVSLGAPIKVAK